MSDPVDGAAAALSKASVSESTPSASAPTPSAAPVEAAAPAAAAAEATPAAAPAAAVAVASSSSSSEEANKDDEDKVEEADSTAEYTPVVQLKQVEVTTGEENDDILYKQRAGLYRFDADSNSWKERGKGEVKLLKNRDTKSIRILLRQEKTLKLCINHKVHPEIDLVANAGSDRSWTWRTLDYSTEEPEKQTFAIRFKDSEVANQFKAEYDKARQSNAANDKERGIAPTAASPAK